MNRRISSLAAAMMIATLPAAAQWVNVPTKGIPRTRDGKPDLSAPAPRKPDGKPDLSGIWQMDRNIAQKYGPNILADFKPGELPIQPWAEAVAKERGDHINEYPYTHCLPPGIPILNLTSAVGYPLKIVHEPD